MTMPQIHDPALPGLARAMHVEAMLTGLSAEMVARSGGAWWVTAGHLVRFRYRAGARAVLHYEIGLHGPDGACRIPASVWLFAGGKARKHAAKFPAPEPGRMPAVLLERGSDALACFFPVDRHAPQVARFVDDHAGMAARLLGEPPMAPPVLVRYRPGLGATFRWRGNSRTAYVKIFAEGQPSTMRNRLLTLSEAVRGSQVAVPVPIGADDRIGALSLAEAGGTSLAEILAGWRIPEIEAATGRVARALATLHVQRVTGIRGRDAAALAATAGKSAELISAVCGNLGRRAREIVRRIADGLRPLPAQTTHMDMKIEHLLVSSRLVSVLDLDSLSLSDPVYDIAMLEARIEALCATGGCSVAQAKTGRRALIDGYSRATPPGWSVRLPWLRACAALQVAKHHVQNPSEDWRQRAERALVFGTSATQSMPATESQWS